MQHLVEADKEYTRGDTDSLLNIRVWDDADNCVPSDLTGYTYRITLDTLEEPPNAATNVLTRPGTITGNLVQFFPADASDTDLLGEHFYDAERTDPGGLVKTVAKGKFDFTQDISK